MSAVIFKIINISYPNNIIYYVACSSIIQLILIVLPFRFRRLKNGMPFLKEKGSSNAGVLISVILHSCVIILSGHTDSSDFIYVVAFASILISAVFILFWWRSRLTRTYMERLRNEEIRRLEDELRKKRSGSNSLRHTMRACEDHT
jgi:hypothetical protein